MYNDNSSQWEPLNFRDISLSNNEDRASEKKGSEVKKQTNEQLNSQHDSAEIDAQDASDSNLEIAENASKQDDEAIENALFSDSKERGYQEGYQEGYQAAHEAGYQEGYNAGKEEGYHAGQQESMEKISKEMTQKVDKERMLAVQSILDLVANFQKALNDLDKEIVPTLTNLAITAAKKMVDSLPDGAYQQLSVTTKELLQQFPILGKSVHVYINPNDMESVQTLLSDELEKYDWHLITDHSIESGGCKILTEKNEIDATSSSKFQVMSEVINKGNS